MQYGSLLKCPIITCRKSADELWQFSRRLPLGCTFTIEKPWKTDPETTLFSELSSLFYAVCMAVHANCNDRKDPC